MKRTKERFDIMVTTAGGTFSKTFELDKNITSIRGLMMSSDLDDVLYYRGTQRIEINKEEIFPENYESKHLMSGINSNVNGRYYLLGNFPTGNGQVRLEYKDNDCVRMEFRPYRISLYLDCNCKDQ